MSANLGETVRLGRKVSEEDSAVTLQFTNDVSGTVVAASNSSGNNLHAVVIGCAPINSMVLGKEPKPGDRQTLGFGEEGDPSPTIQANHHHAVAMAYDGFNQSGKEECCHTLGTCNSESPNNDKVVKVAQSFGINPQSGQMLPFDKECGETLAIDHQGGACLDLMGGKTGAHFTTDDSCPTLTHGRGSASDVHSVVLENIIRNMRYTVRRLTPTECERLMGLPDGWTIPSNLKVTDDLVEEFCRVHDNFNRIMAEYDGKPPPKPKSANQVRKWLEKITNPDTCPDAPRYKGCGNGWATNQPRWILARMLAADGVNPFDNN